MVTSKPAFFAIGAALAAAIVAGCATSEHDPSVGAKARGRALAERVCAQCHAVSAEDAVSPNDKAPTFASLAGRPDMNRTALKILLRTPHANMPNFIVPEDETDDIAAYLETLRGI